MAATNGTANNARARAARAGARRTAPWKAWGPYLSERQWGTVREDYSADGDAWNYFTHDQARSRAYRWGEDGIAGICDERQRLCLALALWNGADPILKERMFGLTNSEGNHGEDVKEYWFYLDSTPTHSYLKCQYKYPQRAFPYEDLVATNGAPRQAGDGVRAARHRRSSTRTATSTSIVEYAKAAPRRHPDARHGAQPRPGRGDAAPAADAVVPQHVVVGRRGREADARGRTSRRAAARRAPPRRAGRVAAARRRSAQLLFCENETNNERLFGAPNASPYVKDGDQRLRRLAATAARSTRTRTGTKVAAHHVLDARRRARARRSACA